MKILILLLLIPLASALDCNLITNQQLCQEIQNSNISIEEKSYLLADIITNDKYYPNHAYIRNWNLQIPTNTAPENITLSNQKYIKNAFVKILTVMPSVLLNNTLLINKSGEVLTSANYNLEMPSGTMSGDCKTEYNLIQNNAVLSAYLNNQELGKDNLVAYSNAQNNAEFKADYDITVLIQIRHYHKERVCSGKKCKWVCSYQHTENSVDYLVLQDTLNAQVENSSLQAEFKIKEQSSNYVKANFTFSPAVNLALNFYAAYYQEHNYVFSEVSSGRVLIVKAEAQNSTAQKNLIYKKGEVLVQNTANCQINISDFFQQVILPCDLSYQDDDFTLKTDKLVYAPHEKITLTLTPEADYLINYAEKNSSSRELVAEFPYNRITVSKGERQKYALIHVQNKPSLNLLFSLTLFGTFNYALIGVVRKYWGWLE